MFKVNTSSPLLGDISEKIIITTIGIQQVIFKFERQGDCHVHEFTATRFEYSADISEDT